MKKVTFVLCVVIIMHIMNIFTYAETLQEEFDSAISLLIEGDKFSNNSNFIKAIEKWESALPAIKRLAKPELVGLVSGNLGLAHRRINNNEVAKSYYEEAIQIVDQVGDKKTKAIYLVNLGVVYENLKNNDKKIDSYEQAITIYEELGDKKNQALWLGFLGEAYVAIGNTLNAAMTFKKLVSVSEYLGDTKNIMLRSGMLGDIFQARGENDKAISSYNKALSIADVLDDVGFKGKVLGGLGNCYAESGSFQKSGYGNYRLALEFYNKALQASTDAKDDRSVAIWLAGLSASYTYLGEYRQAINYADKAIAIADKISDKRVKSGSLGNLGNAYNRLGDYKTALSYYTQALKTSEELGDKKSIGAWLHNIGILEAYSGNYLAAIDHSKRTISIAKEIGIPYDLLESTLGGYYMAIDDYNLAYDILRNNNHKILLGIYYLKKGELDKAIDQFNTNREEDEKAKISSRIVPRWLGLGLAQEGLYNFESAYNWYIKTVELMEKQRVSLNEQEKEHYFEGKETGIPRIEAYEGAARCAFMLGKYDEAFYWAENTRGRITSELLSSRHAGSNPKIPVELAKEEDDITTQIIINKKQQQTAFEKNNPELLKQLETEYPALKTKMDNLIDRLRKEYPQYAAIKYPQPVTLSQLALKPGETIIEYEVTDPYTIGMVIRDGKVIKSFKVDKTRKELEALVKKFRAPFQEGADINSFSLNQATTLADLLIKPALSAVNKGDRLIIIPDESLSLLPFESLLLTAPAAALKEEATLLAQADKQSASGAVDKASIIRGLSKPAATRSTGVYVAPRVSTRILFDTGSSNISKESGKLLKEIVAALGSKELKGATIRIEGHTDSVGDPKFNLRLSQKRARSVYDYLAKNGIPAARLNYTGKGDTEPVAENSDEKGRSRNRRVDFVRVDSVASNQKSASATTSGFVYAMDEYPISYYQSASVLSLQRGLKLTRAQDKSFFGLGDPVYDTSDTRSAGMRGLKVVEKDKPTAGSDIATNEETKDAGYQFGRLVNTGKEIKEVGKLFSNSKLFTGVDASEEKLKSEDLSSKKYLLFSTHGILGNEIPYIKQPALVLNLIGNDKEDGFLTASEILNINLNADVVALSACKTGLGVQSAGEGVVGLSRAFMYAGTDTVLVSLWSVADESTYKLMVKFFEGVDGGKDKMTALKDAKNYLRTNGYANPFYWAPFILMGEAN